MSDDYSDEAAIDEEAMLAAAEASPALLAENKRLRASHDRLLIAAKDLLDTIPAPPTDTGRRVFEALHQAIWDAAP